MLKFYEKEREKVLKESYIEDGQLTEVDEIFIPNRLALLDLSMQFCEKGE